MFHFFSPRGNRAGTHPIFLTAAIPTVTANTTTTLRFASPYLKGYFLRASANLSVVGADADGAITFIAYKRDVSAGADVALTSAMSLESGTIAATNKAFVATTAANESQKVIDFGDTFHVIFTSDSAAIDTQPVGFISIEVGLKE